MKILADFHIHSYLSRATSPKMNLDELSRNAKLKGLNLLGTGDFTHPIWLRELKEKLEPLDDSGLFSFNSIFWILTAEVSTVYEQGDKIRKIHHVIHASSFEIVDQINEVLSKRGNLSSDGRPILNGLTSPELVEILMNIYEGTLIIPAHAWTSWWGVVGASSGFDSISECYQDQTKNIYAIETGLSSDPPMNWRLSSLDRFCLMSNSDAHSPWIWRLGREFNVFDLEKVSYNEILDSVKKKDTKRFIFTVEVPPEYGKYHYTGHRNCGISLRPKDAIKLGNICPKCGRKLTIGVLQRVETLADRPEGFVPKDAIPYKSLLPLYELISYVMGANQLYSRKVMNEQDKLIAKFDNELNVLLYVMEDELLRVTHAKIADAIIKNREGKLDFVAGYDGVYGNPIFHSFENQDMRKKGVYKKAKSLDNFL
ncbi:MAG: endonuclease Q family protein [Candidatus Methylarchaceae archaeon HK02M1]|nr:endonuclease Q family protein [Candidatus Methylarchaceae archaeon HK02M1]